MPIKGNAFMVIWHDIRTEFEPDYNRWHTREHMPERLSIPGFERGRRGVDWALGSHRYLTVYEGPDLGVFGSPAYLERLNNPTPWTLRVQPAFYNFIRCGCEVVLSQGEGVGGAMATFRIGFGAAGEAELRQAAPAIVEEIMVLDGVSSVHVGAARPESTGAKTKETELRGTTKDGVFDATVLVDGIGRREIEAVTPRIAEILAECNFAPQAGDAAIYDMAFALDSLL